MAIFTIGDLHLSLGTEKPMDIFEGWGNYTERLRANWERLVSDGDTVVVPGDISWAMQLVEAEADFRFLDALPGQKILLKGNHDYWWSTRKKMDEWLVEKGFGSIRILFNDAYTVEGLGICGTRSWFYDESEPDNEKILNRELGRLRASLSAPGCAGCEEKLVFLHYPPVYCRTAVEPVVAMLREFGVRRCYYGHIHGQSIRYAFGGVRYGIAYKLVSADNLGFSPYRIL